MIIQGFQKVTLLDFPGEVASTVFTYGCNMRCPFCHNPDLVDGKINKDNEISREEIFSYLEKRKKILGGVCITGGEPLLQEDLTGFMEEIRELGLKIKLDTNGTLPEILKELKPDYIAMDIKTSPEKYGNLGFKGKDVAEKISESVKWIVSSGIDHEFRTTVVPGLVTNEDIGKISSLIFGAKLYVLAQFRNKKLLDPSWEQRMPYEREVFDEMKSIVIENGIACDIRANY